MMSELRVEVIAVPSVCKAKTQEGDKIIVHHSDHKVSEIVFKQLKGVTHDMRCFHFFYFPITENPPLNFSIIKNIRGGDIFSHRCGALF